MWRRAVVGALVVLVAGWWLAGFIVGTQAVGSYQTYQADWGGARWIATGEPGVPGYFRDTFVVPSQPQQAVLWISADQSFLSYINKTRVGSFNYKYLSTGLYVRGFDVTKALTPGTDVMAVKVVNYDGRTPALKVNLVMVFGTRVIDVTSGTNTWLATGDVRNVLAAGNAHAVDWRTLDFMPLNWQPPQVVPDRPEWNTTAVPASLLDTGLSGSVVTSPNASDDILATTQVTVPGPAADGWIRIGASDPFAVFLNGNLVLSTHESEPLGSTSLERLLLYRIGPRMSNGVNLLTVHVIGDHPAAVYLDGYVQTTSGATVRFATGIGWNAADSPFSFPIDQPATAAAREVGLPATVWPGGVQEHLAPSSLASPSNQLENLIVLGSVLAAWVLTAWLARRAAGIPLREGLGIIGMAHLPVLVAIALTGAFAHFSGLPPPFPHITAMIVVLAVLVVLADLLPLAVLAGYWHALKLHVAARYRQTRTAAGTYRPSGSRLREFGRRHWAALSVGVIAAAVVGINAYGLGYDALWQDEGTSVTVAHAMITHGAPVMDSGYLDLKGELYEAVLGVVGAATGWSIVAMRALSVGLYGLTVLAFGLVLLPTLFPRRRLFWVALTLIFATAPAEMAWAQEIRMYQMEQLFFILFIAVFIRALRRPTTLAIAGSMALCVAMYLAHEESFVVLPAVPIVFLATQRLRWIRDWRWWVFGGLAAGIILGEYALTVITHPVGIGTDFSSRPYVMFDPNYFWYYLNVVFFPPTAGAGLIVVSTFALIGSVVGLVRREPTRLATIAFFWITLVVLSTLFSASRTPRYTFILLPALFALAGYGGLDILGLAGRWISTATGNVRGAQVARGVVRATAALAVVWLMVSLSGGIRSYGIAVSRLTGTNYSHARVNFDNLYRYYFAHSQPGDSVAFLAPTVIMSYYLQRDPDVTLMSFTNHLLYLEDENAEIVDSTYGKPVIFTVDDFQAALLRVHRMWLFVDGSVIHSEPGSVRTFIEQQFSPVAESESGTLYLWQG